VCHFGDVALRMTGKSRYMTKRKMGVIAAFMSAAAVLPGAVSAACYGCTIEMHDGSLPARAYGEAIGGAVVGMVGGAAGTAAGDHAGTSTVAPPEV
jgi:hypothetical protein